MLTITSYYHKLLALLDRSGQMQRISLLGERGLAWSVIMILTSYHCQSLKTAETLIDSRRRLVSPLDSRIRPNESGNRIGENFRQIRPYPCLNAS